YGKQSAQKGGGKGGNGKDKGLKNHFIVIAYFSNKKHPPQKARDVFLALLLAGLGLELQLGLDLFYLFQNAVYALLHIFCFLLNFFFYGFFLFGYRFSFGGPIPYQAGVNRPGGGRTDRALNSHKVSCHKF